MRGVKNMIRPTFTRLLGYADHTGCQTTGHRDRVPFL